MKLIVSAIGLLVSSCAFSGYDYKTDVVRQKIIVDGYYSFVNKYHRSPRSLAEVVNSGCLPEKGYFYSSRVDLFLPSRLIDYRDSDYVIVFPPIPGSHKIVAEKNPITGELRFCGDVVEYAEKMNN